VFTRGQIVALLLELAKVYARVIFVAVAQQLKIQGKKQWLRRW
jgi:hypothetical protein